MFIERVTADQWAYASRLIAYYNFGQRGMGDGNETEQLTGMIGQTVMADLLDMEKPTGEGGFDEGVDFIINERSVDVKTMTRTTDVRDYYVHNFIGYQRDYDVDYYIFTSYNKRNRAHKKSLLQSLQFTHEEALENTPVSACGFVLSVSPVVKMCAIMGIVNFTNFVNTGTAKHLTLCQPYSYFLEAM